MTRWTPWMVILGSALIITLLGIFGLGFFAIAATR